MYSIGNIIVGVPMPWDLDQMYEIAAAHTHDLEIAASWMERFNATLLDESDHVASALELREAIEQCDVEQEEIYEWLTEVGWEAYYHGSADVKPMSFGVEIGEIDDTDHFPVSSIPAPTAEQRQEAIDKYNKLPAQVREKLPPLGVYIVWSSS
jgi:hypothetical protein